MDVDSIWKSLKNEGDGISCAKGECGTSVITKCNKPIAFRPFDIEEVAKELTLNHPKYDGCDSDNEVLDSYSDSFCCLGFDEKIGTSHNSEDEVNTDENELKKEHDANTKLRVERLAQALRSDYETDRVETLSKLNEIINSLRVNLPQPAEMKYPPPYDNDMITLNRNLPLVSDLVKSELLLEGKENLHPTTLSGSCLKKHHDGASATTRLQLILNSCGSSLFRLIGDGKSEKSRGLAISCVQSLLLAGIDTGRHIPFLIPALCARYPPSSYDKDLEVFVQDAQSHEFYKRGGATNRQDKNHVFSRVVEPSEELRIELCKTFYCLLRGALSSCTETSLAKYYPDIIFSLQSSLLDPFPELRIEACNVFVQLLRVPHWQQGARYFATGLARSALQNCRHKKSNVIIAAMNLFEASVCVPDKAKGRGAGTMAIADLVGFQVDNVLPIAAFYDSKYNVSVNILAELATHKNHRVRMRCCEMLSYFLVFLPDRYDHQPRLLPYVLSFISDDSPEIQRTALDCIEKCGFQYEREHPDDVIERRQFGVDGDDTIDYDNNLPMPFLHRPNLGARLFVRANTCRIFLAVLTELSNWREQTRKRSAELLLILTVYGEEHLTKNFHHTVASIARAISVEKSSKMENGRLTILDTIQQVLRLMGKYIDPASYLPLMCPRISGDTSSATSNSEDGYHSETSRSIHGTILKSLIEGAPLRRLLLHWVSLATLLTNADCIGPYVGTQTRHECISAFHALIVKVLCDDGCVVKDFVSHFTNNEDDMAELNCVLSSSGVALGKLQENHSIGRDAMTAQECLDGLSKIQSAIATDRA